MKKRKSIFLKRKKLKKRKRKTMRRIVKKEINNRMRNLQSEHSKIKNT